MPIPLSLADAEKAFRQILTQFSPYLPKNVYEMARAKPIGDIFEICDADRYKAMFDITWNRAFKKANQMIFGGRDVPASAVPAFTSDVDDIAQRRVYLQKGVVSSWGTYYHESIHYLQHKDMYPIYYATGGDAQFKMAGLTEYCTRYGRSHVARERATHGNYQKNFQRTASFIGTDLKREGDLFEVNFRGTGLPKDASNAEIVTLLHGIVP